LLAWEISSPKEMVSMSKPADDIAGEVVVQARGEVSAAERSYAREKIDRLRSLVPGPVLFARVDLTAHADPARERPAFAKAELDVNGRLVRAHVAASTMFEAVDSLEARLRERLERFAHREESKHLRHRGADEHEWRHGDWAESRPSYFPRPVEEREVVRRKAFPVGEMTPDEAVFDLELLDHDFYLFRNLETGEDNVVFRSEGSGYELMEPSSTCSLADSAQTIRHSAVRPSQMSAEEAIEMLDLSNLAFVFFVDPDDGGSRVVYRRYDGHYGLIMPAGEER
jgi:ribosome-associated translation inhibitor RaiA